MTRDVWQVECVVIGAGVIGLACARHLARQGKEVIIVEKESQIGQHSSSRNSEVIHAGIYYPPDSAKAKHCLRGKPLLYEFAKHYHVDVQHIGKLLVATNSEEELRLGQIYQQSKACGMHDLYWLDAADVQKKEPALSVTKALYSPSTGIIDTHGLMLALLGDAQTHGAQLVTNTEFKTGLWASDGFTLTLENQDQCVQLQTRHVVNCAGLWATDILAGIQGIPVEWIPEVKYFRGQYFSYQKRSPFQHLIYPIPAQGGLGIHATLDLQGELRFGPDIQPVQSVDYQMGQEGRTNFAQAIRRYWPEVEEQKLEPSYVGVRVKCSQHPPKTDFYIQRLENEHSQIVSFCGIESPGLTSCLSLAAMLDER